MTAEWREKVREQCKHACAQHASDANIAANIATFRFYNVIFKIHSFQTGHNRTQYMEKHRKSETLSMQHERIAKNI